MRLTVIPHNPADADKAAVATQLLRYFCTTEASEVCKPDWAPPRPVVGLFGLPLPANSPDTARELAITARACMPLAATKSKAKARQKQGKSNPQT